MRSVQHFLAVSLGCVVLSAVSLLRPGAINAALFPNSLAACTRLLESYGDAQKLPKRGTPEYIHYAECYYILCGIRLD